MINVNNAIMENSTETQGLLPLIKEYESMIETLTTQVEFYANEQENLRKEISALISENKALGKTVNELLNSQSTTEKEIEHQKSENELLENLKKQLGLTMKEKDTVVQLWQNALRNIDHLEEELKLFEGRTHGYFSKTEVLKIKQIYEKQIAEMEEQLIQTNLKLDRIKKDSTKNLANKNADLQKAVENQDKTSELVKRLENEVAVLQDKLKEIMVLRDELQNKLDVKNSLIEELKVKDFEAKVKVTEAVQIVEAAFFEKDAALLREAKAKEEVIKISKMLSEIIEEAAEKIKSETGKIREECDLKIKEVQKVTKKLKEELNAKNIELEKCTRECKLLEEELERIRKGNIYIDESSTSKLLILEKNLESTFQKLLVSERKNLQLVSEKECIKADLEQMANCYKNDIKTREIKMQVLKHEIKALKKQLKTTQSSLIQAAGKIDKMNSKVRLVYTEFREKLKAKDIMYDEAIKRTIQEIQNKNEKEHNKFEKYLGLQIEINKKWKKEVHDIIDKFEKRLLELTDVNKSLMQQLKEEEEKNLKYRKSLEDICTSVTHVANVNKKSKSTK